jgi:alcohol dehydrogenase
MTYYMPTYIIEEENAVEKNPMIFKDYGDQALIVTGKRSAKINGALEDVVKVLEKGGVSYKIFDGIEENPPVSNIVEGAAVYPEADYIIGIGGGSPIDGAKAIGVLMLNPELDPYAALFEIAGLKSIPIIAIPTTGGTGTETTPYAIITDHLRKTKINFSSRVFPKVAIMDVRYYMFMPRNIRNNTCIDALTHLVECYMNTNATKYSDYVVEEGFRMWGISRNELLEATVSKEAMTRFMNASTLAGIGISQTGTSLPHGMGYALTYERGVPHGKANALLMAAYLKICVNQQKVERILELLGFESLEALAAYVDNLVGTILIPKADILRYAEGLFANKNVTVQNPQL